MDILFLTIDEPNSAENWRFLQKKCPQAQRLFVDEQACDLSQSVLTSVKSDHFFLVFGHNLVAHDFNFVQPPDLAEDTVYIWKSRNTFFSNLYPFYGIALLSKRLLQNGAQPHIISFPGLCAKLIFIDEIASDYNFNLSPFWSWRAAFLEMLNSAIRIRQCGDCRPFSDFAQLWECADLQQPFADWAVRGAASARILARYLDEEELIGHYSDRISLEKEFQLERRMLGNQDDGDADKVEHYAAFGLAVRQIGPKKYFFTSEITQLHAIGDDKMVSLLQHCYDFRDIPEHVKNFCTAQNRQLLQALVGGGASALLRMLSPLVRIFANQITVLPLNKSFLSRTSAAISRLITDGFLLSDRYIKREIFRCIISNYHQVERNELHTIQSLNIPTKNRPRLLKRALQSYAQNAAFYGHNVVLNVVDDSTDQAVMAENRINLEQIARLYNTTAIFTSRVDRRDFAEKLHRLSEIPLPYCQFCLLGQNELECKMGASRNTIQLQTIGEWSIQVDDDTVCRCIQSPFSIDRVALCAHKIYDYIFHSDDSFYETIECTEVDFIGLHEQLLGANIASPALQRYLSAEDKLVVDDLDSALLRKVVSSTSAIKATFLGSFGDSGEGNSLYRLFVKGRPFQQLVADESEYDKLLCTRFVSKFVPSLTITDIRSCMTMNIGLDNTVAPIPFSPIQRNEDAVFAHLYHIAHLEGLMALQPYAINHAPTFRVPPAKEEQFSTAAGWGLNDCINTLLIRTQPTSEDAFYNLKQAGRFLVDFSNTKFAEFEHAVKDIYREDIVKKIILLQAVLDECDVAPLFWRADMHRLADELQTNLTGEGALMLIDLEGDLKTRLVKSKIAINRFGHMLIFWQDIVNATQELRKRGVRLGVEVYSPKAS